MRILKEPDTIDFLLAQVCHLHHSRIHQLLEDLGLYRGQPQVLRALWEQEGLAHSDLADRLHDSPATITKMLQRMEKAGFVLRRPDPNDQRISRVFLTESGRAIQAEVEDVFKTMEAEVFSGFNQEERVLLRRFLLQIRQNLRQATDEKLSMN